MGRFQYHPDDLTERERFVPEAVTLAFHPDDADVDFRAVWQDSIARLVWVAWKWKHIVNQHFNRECLILAATIRTGDMPYRGPLYEGNFNCSSYEAFWQQFQPVLKGEKGISVSYPGRFGWMITEMLTNEIR